jgi:hypothetical protein
MHEVLDVALRGVPDVVRLRVVVPRQHIHQVVREEHRVVVVHHEPPHVREAQTVALGDDPGDPQRGPAARAMRVGELGRVRADLDDGELR